MQEYDIRDGVGASKNEINASNSNGHNGGKAERTKCDSLACMEIGKSMVANKTIRSWVW